MLRIVIFISLLTVVLTVGGCASTGTSSSSGSSHPPNFKNTKTGEKFYSGDNKEFMETYAECVRKAKRVSGNQSRSTVEKYINTCLSMDGYKKVYSRNNKIRRPSTLGAAP